MGFIGDAIGSVTRPIFGKPSASSQEAATQASTNAANLSTQLAQQIWNEVAPVRNSVINRSTAFMQKGLDPTTSAMYAPLKQQTEAAYDTGRNNLMSQVAGGGALTEGLADLESSKAANMGNLMAQILQDEYNKAYGLASGSPQQTAATLGTAGTIGTGTANALSGQYYSGQSLLNALIGGGSGVLSALMKK